MSIKYNLSSMAYTMDGMDAMSSENVVNSIRISEGPVTHMSMAVKGSSRTPYSDATQVGIKSKPIPL